MWNLINAALKILGFILVAYGSACIFISVVGNLFISFGLSVPEQLTAYRFEVPEIWEAVEQIAGGLTSIVFGVGTFQLARLRQQARIDDDKDEIHRIS